MQEDSARRFSAVANAIVVLVLVLVPMSGKGSQIDHEEVRPWGCRTCTVPADPAPQPTEGPGLGPSGDDLGPAQDEDLEPTADLGLGAPDGDARAAAVALPREPLRLSCGDSCPLLVEIVAAAAAAQCQPCPDSPDAAQAGRLD